MPSEIIVEFPTPLTDKEKKMIYGYKGEVVRCKDCKHRFLEIINGEMVFSCLYRMGTLDLNGYCDCGSKMDEVKE